MKMSKSGQTEPNSKELSLEGKLRAMESEKNYWKTRYELLDKYGNNSRVVPSSFDEDWSDESDRQDDALTYWEENYKDEMTYDEFDEKYYKCDRCGSYELYEDLGCICYAR